MIKTFLLIKAFAFSPVGVISRYIANAKQQRKRKESEKEMEEFMMGYDSPLLFA